MSIKQNLSLKKQKEEELQERLDLSKLSKNDFREVMYKQGWNKREGKMVWDKTIRDNTYSAYHIIDHVEILRYRTWYSTPQIFEVRTITELKQLLVKLK